jgi:hypothetical protein
MWSICSRCIGTIVSCFAALLAARQPAWTSQGTAANMGIRLVEILMNFGEL